MAHFKQEALKSRRVMVVTDYFNTRYNPGAQIERLTNKKISLFGILRSMNLDAPRRRNISKALQLLEDAQLDKWELFQAYHNSPSQS